jgi:hypothetical protein
MTVPNIFASKTGTIPLSELDANFVTPITIGTTSVALGETITSLVNVALINPTLGTPASGNLVNCTNISLTAGVSGVLPVVSGGTGSTTNAGAPFALKGVNSDITSLTGLTTALSVSQGGTGVVTSTGTGDTVLSASPTFTGTVNTANLAYTGTFTGGTGVVAIGTNQIYKDVGGNVGIGTIIPNYKLHVVGAIGSGLTGSNGSYAFRRSSDGTEQAVISVDGTSLIYNNLAGGHVLQTNNTERMRIDSSGNTYIESGNFWQYAPAPTSISAASTLTAAQLQTTIINTTGTTYTVTLPLASAIDTAFVDVPTINIGFDFYVINTATGTITMAVNTGITSVGTLTILTGISAHFRLRRTAANTYILYRI